MEKSIPKLNISPKILTEKLNLLLTDPVLNGDTYFLFFTCDRDPGVLEPVVDSTGIPSDWVYFWINTSTNDLFRNRIPTSGSMVWGKLADDQNILNMLNTLGWNINTNRPQSLRVSPAFSTVYTPNVNNDTEVAAIISSTTLVGNTQVDLKVNTGGGMVLYSREINNSLLSGATFTLYGFVPANSSYELLSVTGTSSIVQITETSL